MKFLDNFRRDIYFVGVSIWIRLNWFGWNQITGFCKLCLGVVYHKNKIFA